jgi:hypothetical protein
MRSNTERPPQLKGDVEHVMARTIIHDMGFTSVETHDDARQLIDSIKRIRRIADERRSDDPDRPYDDM